jgi:hypothetical protein
MANERVRIILEDLEQTLLQFISKHKITHDEYRCATETLPASVKADEESVLFYACLVPHTPGKFGGALRGEMQTSTSQSLT